MKKKNYHVCLDQRKTEELQRWLKKGGLTFSGYLTMLINEQLAAVKHFNLDEPQPVTAVGLLQKAQDMAKSLYEENKPKK